MFDTSAKATAYLLGHSLSIACFHSFPRSCGLCRYDVGTNVFDTSAKARLPAYTDRVLFLSADGDSIKATEYTSYPSIKLSDHKPVSATLHVALCADGEPIKRPYPLSPVVPKDEYRPTTVGDAVGDAVSSGRAAMGSLWRRWSSGSADVAQDAPAAGSVN